MKYWSRISENVQPLAYIVVRDVETFLNGSMNISIIRNACENGWDIAIAPLVDEDGYPFLKSMFLSSYNAYTHSRWFAYTNDDVLYDASLQVALDKVEKELSGIKSNNSLFLASRRRDIEVK